MTPAQANLLRATALLSQAPASGVYRDGVREALAVVDAETARGLNAPRDDTAHLLATQANARRVMEDVGRAKEGSAAYLHRRMDAWESAHVALCDRLTALELAVIAAGDAAHVEAAAGLPDSPDEAGLVREAIWMAIARVDGVPAAAASEAAAEVINALQEIGVDLRQRDELAAFVAAQEPLGREFDRAIHANLSDLYVRSDAPSPAPVDSIVAEVRADLLARSERGIAKYGVTLDRTDLGLREWLVHFREELMDGVLYATRAMRDVTDDAPALPQPDLATQLDWHEERVDLPPAQLNRKFCKVIRDTTATAPVEPPHAAAPVLRPLTPEPADAVLGRAEEALAWDGQQLPVWVEFNPAVKHPYGDDAYQMTTDGKARMFPSREAAQRWLAAMGKAA